MTRERLEGVVNGFREALKRGHRSSEAFRRVERLQLDLALKLYRCGDAVSIVVFVSW